MLLTDEAWFPGMPKDTRLLEEDLQVRWLDLAPSVIVLRE